MIAARLAMAVTALACWDAWRLLAGRVAEPADALLAAATAGLVSWQFVRAGQARVRATPLAAALVLYAAACITGPALLQIGVAAATLALLAVAGTRVARAPFAGLSLLTLPVIPTLDFLLAYPLRRVSAAITLALLRLNGLEVSLNGVALEWQGRSLLFDGPCSGVRMLWATLMLASLVALVRAAGTLAYLRLLALACVIAVAGNALRAASLFYLENGFIEALQRPGMHEGVGLLAFALVAGALLAVPQVRRVAA